MASSSSFSTISAHSNTQMDAFKYKDGCGVSNLLLSQIFSYFDCRLMMNAARVCRNWRDMVYSARKWQETMICVNLEDDICTQTMIPSLIQRNITRMKIDVTYELYNYQQLPINLHYILAKLVHGTTTLKVLYLRNGGVGFHEENLNGVFDRYK